jgi:hypothetical protein
MAAQTSGIDPKAFCRDLERSGAVPLAIKPVTLSMLLKEYATGGGLVSDRWSLYEQGCHRMAIEVNPSRVAARRVGSLTGEQRVSVASRIAAATLVANRYAVWIAPDLTDKPAEDVELSELLGGTEKAHGDSLVVSRQEVEEALDTGLFSSRGSSRLGWAHQTYAEFLAARYIIQYELPLPQVLSLIRHPVGKVVPQLHELSAWIALSADLLSVALDESNDEHIRSFAILAMGECADEPGKAALNTLVTTPRPSDVSDEIKACALTLLWPNHMTTTELFTVLTPSRDDAVFGTYRNFIGTGVARHLEAADLEIALDWVVKLEAGPSTAAFSRNFEMAALADQTRADRNGASQRASRASGAGSCDDAAPARVLSPSLPRSREAF